MWRKLFDSLWKSFHTEFSQILCNLRQHRRSLESQATLIQFSEILSAQEKSRTDLNKILESDNHRRRDVVYQWLCAAKTEVDQETYAGVRKEYPETGRWLLEVEDFTAWFDPDFCSNPLLWLSGIPGAGKYFLNLLEFALIRER